MDQPPIRRDTWREPGGFRFKPRHRPISKPIERDGIITGLQRRRRYDAEEKAWLVG